MHSESQQSALPSTVAAAVMSAQDKAGSVRYLELPHIYTDASLEIWATQIHKQYGLTQVWARWRWHRRWWGVSTGCGKGTLCYGPGNAHGNEALCAGSL